MRTMPCLFAALLLPLAIRGQEPAKLRCQVLDDAGAPRACVHVLGTLHRGQEPLRHCDIVTAGDGIATLPWATGDKGTVELRLLVVGAEPRRVLDLERAPAELLTMRLPPVGSLAIDFTLADGSPLPKALAGVASAFVPVHSTRVGDADVQLTSIANDGVAVLQPLALDLPLRLTLGGLPLDLHRDEPALTKAEPERTITWALPADLVWLHGRLQLPAGVEIGKAGIAVRIASERGSTGWALAVAADRTFAVPLSPEWRGVAVDLEFRQLQGHASVKLPPRLLLTAGANDLGTVELRAEPELLHGRILLDGAPAPPTFVLAWQVRCQPPDIGRVPQVVPICADGRFQLIGPDTNVARIAISCPDWHYRVDPPAEFVPGQANVTVNVRTLPVLGVELLVDDVAFGNATKLRLALRRPTDQHDFPSLLSPKPDAPGVLLGGWPGKAGGDFVLRADLTATGELLFESEAPVAIEMPRLSASRLLPPVDLRGKLHWLHLGIEAPPPARGDWRQVAIRRHGSTPWHRQTFASRIDCIVGGPVDVVVFGDDLWIERRDDVLGACPITPRPAAAVAVMVTPPPPTQKDIHWRLRGTHDDLARGGEFDFAYRPAGLGADVAADGTALLRCPLPGNWHVRLVAQLPGGKELEIGDDAVLHVESPEPRRFELKLREADYEALPK